MRKPIPCLEAMSAARARSTPGPYVTEVECRAPSDPATAGSYPWSIPAVSRIASEGRLALHPHVTFLVGENGSGKSTLLEAIALSLGLNP